MFVLDCLFLACCCLFAFQGHKVTLFKDDDPGKVRFGTVAVLAPGCDALRQSSVGQPLERGIYPAKTECLLYNGEVWERARHGGFSPVGGHPAVMRRSVIRL